MQFVIFDLEATCWSGNNMGKPQEIIEIGALLVDGYGDVLSRFQRLIRPVLHPRLSPYCQELTTISQEEVNEAQTFDRVAEQFEDWLSDAENYYLCAWGAKDQVLLRQDCALHGIDDYWCTPYINLKEQYHEIHGLRRRYGLKKALTKEGIEFDGTHHRAMPDAVNLLKLFVRYIDVWRY